jgi:hypothetical protein
MTELIFVSLLDEIIGVNGVWILQKAVYGGTETCQRGLYVWYMFLFANTRKKLALPL